VAAGRVGMEPALELPHTPKIRSRCTTCAPMPRTPRLHRRPNATSAPAATVTTRPTRNLPASRRRRPNHPLPLLEHRLGAPVLRRCTPPLTCVGGQGKGGGYCDLYSSTVKCAVFDSYFVIHSFTYHRCYILKPPPFPPPPPPPLWHILALVWLCIEWLRCFGEWAPLCPKRRSVEGSACGRDHPFGVTVDVDVGLVMLVDVDAITRLE
jgi:hypothetical protein